MSYHLTDRCPHFEVVLEVVDVALSFMREDPWGRPLPDVDWRLTARLPSGAEVTFNYQATAADVAAYLQREGVEPVGEKL